MKSFFLTTSIVLCTFASAALAEVYKIERDGKVTYSTQPPAKGAKPAELPKLGRWEVAKVSPSQATCENHGGLNCGAGADTDGSVVCLDGFKDSVQPFVFSCTAAKLDIIEVSKINEHGGVTVVVRNSKPVAAKDTLVSFKPNKFDQEMRFEGPVSVEPFGVAEFYLQPQSGFKAAPTLAQLSARCANCG